MTSMERLDEVCDYALEYGREQAMARFGIGKETIKRYFTQWRTEKGEVEPVSGKNVNLAKIAERYTDKELKAIAEGRSINTEPGYTKVDFTGEEIKIGYVTDTHMGSKYFEQAWWESFLEECHSQDVDYIFHSGDLIEGMSNRADHVYSLDKIGFSAQMDYAEEMLSMSGIPIKIIDGNHDRWGIKSNGILAVPDIAKRLPHVEFIGHDNGTVNIGGTEWMLWHGEDGSSYATSYRIQKVLESFTGGRKPHVLMAGHVHKQGYFFDRNVHSILGGALCRQSRFMQSKRLPNHSGFHIIKASIADSQVKWFEPRWYPLFEY